MLLGDIIKQYRSEHNLSMQNFADLIYSSKSYVSMLEKNVNPATGKPIKPSIETLKSIANAMHLQIEDLLSLLDDKQKIILNEDTYSEQFNIHFKNSQERLKKCREENNYTIEDLAQILNIDKNKLYRWENISPASMPTTAAQELADLYEVDPVWLIGYDVPKKAINSTNKIETIQIPIVGRVAAGCPILAEEEIIDTVDIPKEWLKDGYNYFGLRVKGDSMFPRILDGDYVIVRQQNEINSGNIGIILINGDEAVVKEVHITNDGITLKSYNPMYPDMVFSKKDVITKPVTIVGRVVKMIGNNFDE